MLKHGTSTICKGDYLSVFYKLHNVVLVNSQNLDLYKLSTPNNVLMECCVTAYHNIHQMKDIGTFTVVSKNSIYNVSITCNRMSQINLLTTVEVQDLLFGEHQTISTAYCL